MPYIPKYCTSALNLPDVWIRPLFLLLYPLHFDMNFFHKDDRGGIVDDPGNEAAAN